MASPVSPLAPAATPAPPPIAGLRLAGVSAGIRYRGRTDLMLAELAPGTAIAGVLTRSTMPGAPVDWCRRILPGGKVRGIVVNSGNANVFTGRAGLELVERTAAATAALLGCAREEIFVSSTGVIGERLPAEALLAALPRAQAALAADGWTPASQAIMTTDTFPKLAWGNATIDGTTVTIAGFAKGSGMIAPDMATMLGYVFTDAAVAAPALQAMLNDAVDRSFNSITVDGDTSTSDTVLLCATGKAAHRPVTDAGDPRAAQFRAQVDAILRDLAIQIVRDGEGAEKFVTIRLVGAESDRAARRIGLAIGNSPLVKTALAAADANWGRIVAAIGKSGEKADRDKLMIGVGGTLICRDGGPVAGYDEAPVAAHMKGREIEIDVDLGIGAGSATVWTCDLTHRYIDINGNYRS
jgi:glutamate N-acetyltransferase / amino-acid N-acetyltransferase